MDKSELENAIYNVCARYGASSNGAKERLTELLISHYNYSSAEADKLVSALYETVPLQHDIDSVTEKFMNLLHGDPNRFKGLELDAEILLALLEL